MKYGPGYVYRYFDRDDNVLYVGLTDDFGRRLKEHHQIASWFPNVQRCEVFFFDDYADAEMTESTLIRANTPLHNVARPNKNESIRRRNAGGACPGANACAELAASWDRAVDEAKGRTKVRLREAASQLTDARLKVMRLESEVDLLRFELALARGNVEEADDAMDRILGENWAARNR